MDKRGEQKIMERSIPGMNRGPGARFAQVEHAENIGATLKRILTYFAKEKLLVAAMLAVVLFGTLCGVYAPSVQSKAIDMIAGSNTDRLLSTVILMAAAYLLYSGSQLLQGLLSARLSQNIVRHMREELFGKLVDMPIRYMDTHSHGDVMSRMTNDIENISTTVSQSLPSLFSGVLTIAGTMAIMLWYCWQLALLSCATVVLTLLATKFLSKSFPQKMKFPRCTSPRKKKLSRLWKRKRFPKNPIPCPKKVTSATFSLNSAPPRKRMQKKFPFSTGTTSLWTKKRKSRYMYLGKKPSAWNCPHSRNREPLYSMLWI